LLALLQSLKLLGSLKRHILIFQLLIEYDCVTVFTPGRATSLHQFTLQTVTPGSFRLIT
jgi:hypothetical protein